MRNLTTLSMVAALAAFTLGTVACDRSADKATETHTTSAPAPIDPSLAPPQPPKDPATNDQSGAAPQSAPLPTTQLDDRNAPLPNSRGSMGTTTGTQTDRPVSPNSGTALPSPDSTTNTAPGHIMFPPDKGPGTGEPNSAGSHDMGAGRSPTKR